MLINKISSAECVPENRTKIVQKNVWTPQYNLNSNI